MPYDQDRTTTLHTMTSAGFDVPAGRCFSLLLYHRFGSQMVALHEGQSVVVGRARPADVPIHDASLSRQHARFTLIDGEVWVEDLDSTNGTRVNGKKVRRNRVKELDEVQLGAVAVALHVLEQREAELQGMDSHDRFMAKLEQEMMRAKTFGRQTAVLMVRAAKRQEGHISRWGPRVRALLRPVDLVALYDASSVLIALAEAGQQEAEALAAAILGAEQKNEPSLVVGIAVFPTHAASVDELLAVVRTAAQQATARHPVVPGGAPVAAEVAEGKPLIANARMRETYEMARRVAEAEIPVLIYGETGTGKEVLARMIHEHSKRRRKPMRCLNCASIPEQLVESALFGHERGAFTSADQRAAGIFEEAQGGTVLLDEIGELSPSAQAALLRVIETKRVSRVGSSKDFEVDVRILAATHRDLEAMCGAGQFRWDLFYRLYSMVFRIPPLRERIDEIVPLARHFMQLACKTNQCKVSEIDAEAQKLLQRYAWPGNVRELRNVVERAVVIAQDGVITVDDLSERVRRGAVAADAAALPERQAPGEEAPSSKAGEEGLSIKEKVQRFEAQLLLDALRQNEWNQTKTAAALGMPLRTLVHKMGLYGLKKRYECE